MWKFVSVFALVLLFTRSNGLPVESVQDEDLKGSPEIPELSTDLQPPREDAEVIDFRNFETTKDKHTPSTKLELPRREISTPFQDDDELTPSEELQPPKKSMAEPFYHPIDDEDEPPKYLRPPSPTVNERFREEDSKTIPENSSTGLIDSQDNENKTLGAVFIINLYGVKQPGDDENGTDALADDVVSRYPEMLESVATVILVLEEADESKPLDLDEFAKDLEDEGLEVEKMSEDGETKVIKVDFDKSIEDNDVELIKPGKFNKARRRRSPCLHCEGGGLLSKLLDKHRHRGGGGGGGCQGGCGGGYPNQGTVGVIPVVIVEQQRPHYHQPPPRPHYQPQPVYVQPQPHYVQPQPQPHYVQPQPHYVQPQPVYRPPSGGCNTCGGGNHGSYSQSSAQASAQSSSNSW